MTAPENIRERLAEALCSANKSRYATPDYYPCPDCKDKADALLPLIDTLLREQAEGIAAAIQRMTLPSEALEHPYPVDMATAAAADLARTFGGER